MKKLNVKLPQGGSKRALHSGMYASALAVVVLAVIILVNLVIRAMPTKYTEYDISTTSLFTLSDTTENLLHELNADVTAYYLAESGQEDANITRLLDRYAGESSHFSWQQRDPVLYPTFAQQYDGASAGSVVLVCGDNSDVLSYNDMYEMDLESYYTTGTANYSFQAENALTSGIEDILVNQSETYPEMVDEVAPPPGCFKGTFHGEGKDWHRTRESAIKRAEAMRKKKIISLRRQLAKFQKMTFQ